MPVIVDPIARIRPWLGACAALVALWTCGAGAQPAVTDEPIIVSGASGNLGGQVVESLLNDWHIPPEQLILVSRTPAKLEHYADLGASVRFGDFAEPESLDAAYAGGKRMLLISIGGGGNRIALQSNAIDAAVRAGVESIAYTSYVNVDRYTDSIIGPDHRETERLIRASGLAWTMLRNQIYADGIVDQAVQAIDDGEIVTDTPDAQVGYVMRADCAAAAAAVLATDGHANKAYNITGPDLIGPREIAALASEISGRPVALVALTRDELVARLKSEGLSDAAIQGQLAFAAELASPWLAVTTTAVEDLTGRRPQSVRSLLEANRDRLVNAGR